MHDLSEAIILSLGISLSGVLFVDSMVMFYRSVIENADLGIKFTMTFLSVIVPMMVAHLIVYFTNKKNASQSVG